MAEVSGARGSQEEWQLILEWPLVCAAALLLAGYAWPILQPDLSERWRVVCAVVTWATWLVFAADYAIRVVLAHDRLRYVREHLFDLAIIVLPILRPLRLLRLVMTIEVLNRKLSVSFRGRVATYVVSSAGLVIFCAALAVLESERADPHSGIKTFGEALWWAFVTVTTVGYGDYSPVTGTGKFVAVGLMLTGIALLGVVTATLASWFVEHVEQSETATQTEVAELAAEVRLLRAALEAVLDGDAPRAGVAEALSRGTGGSPDA